MWEERGGGRVLRGAAVTIFSSYTTRTAVPSHPLRIAILDSSPGYRAALRAVIHEHEWQADCCDQFADLLTRLEAGVADVVVLDMRDVPAPEHELSRMYQTMPGPIVALAEEDAALKSALRAGATLALRKPLDPDFFVLAIDAVLHRGLSLRSLLGDVVRIGDLHIHLSSHAIERNGRRQVLSNTEWQLFAVLLGHPGRIYARDELASAAWGSGYAGRRAQIELYISRLRRKVESDSRSPQVIETVRHLGYRLGMSTAPPAESDDVPDAIEPPEMQPAVTGVDLEAWITGYRDLIAIKSRLEERARELITASHTGAFRKILQADLRMMEPEMDRFQHRLAFWETRKRELAEGAASASA
jgi:DNA-binding response OmpR family regulator